MSSVFRTNINVVTKEGKMELSVEQNNLEARPNLSFLLLLLLL
jgi:hypothetical protein